MEDCVVELASSDRLALAISVEVQKKFQKYVSRQTVIKRLVENHFKYRKLFKVPELSDSQIILRYKCSILLLKNFFNIINM